MRLKQIYIFLAQLTLHTLNTNILSGTNIEVENGPLEGHKPYIYAPHVFFQDIMGSETTPLKLLYLEHG